MFICLNKYVVYSKYFWEFLCGLGNVREFLWGGVIVFMFVSEIKRF